MKEWEIIIIEGYIIVWNLHLSPSIPFFSLLSRGGPEQAESDL